MNENIVPKYLYHYTDINTLALILKHKNIRFNRLDRLDDLNEGLTKDLGEMGKYVFVSCWTESSEESIPFWNMYTKDMCGVRIKLKSNPFRLYKIPKLNSNGITVDIDIDICFKLEWLVNNDYLVIPKWDMLEKVKYTDKEAELFPNLIKFDGEYTSISFGTIGQYKRIEWSFQREWRYLVIFMPFSIYEYKVMLNSNNPIQNIYDRLMSKGDLPFDDIYLEIAEDAFNDLHITLGPCVNEGDKIIVEALKNEYCPLAKIEDSVLENTIRR